MEEKSTEIIIKAGTCLLKDLLSFKESYILKIPEYQRPYVWNPENLVSLIEDLTFHNSNKDFGSYYLGSILLFKNQNTYEIIDGQQRLTTMLIIDSIVNEKDCILLRHKDKIEFNFNSPISQKSIVENKKYLKTQINFLKIWNDVYSQLLFSIIITNNEDESFAFFETQNNRGVKLSPVDFLKSYHLRELKGEESNQIAFATVWDRNNRNQSLDYLYQKILWRNRSWRGSEVDFESNDLILKEFQKKTRKKNKTNIIKLYPNQHNRIADYAKYDEENGMTIQTFPISLQIKPKDYPFTLRQPIEKGVGFFLYSEKYHDLYNIVFKTDTKNQEIQKYNTPT